jgi:hypothetical protein
VGVVQQRVQPGAADDGQVSGYRHAATLPFATPKLRPTSFIAA